MPIKKKGDSLKILILSDSHRSLGYMIEAIDQEKPDHVIHLGDHIGDAEELSRRYPLLTILMVRGNCDLGDFGSEEVLTEFRGKRFLACHGHRYDVKNGLLRLTLAAREKQVDVALFGHTHQAVCECYDGIWFINPGSCRGTRPSCAIIELNGDCISCRIERFDPRGV